VGMTSSDMKEFRSVAKETWTSVGSVTLRSNTGKEGVSYPEGKKDQEIRTKGTPLLGLGTQQLAT